MNAVIKSVNFAPYARAIAASKRARWELDADVLRGRALEQEHKYLPDGLSLAHTLTFLSFLRAYRYQYIGSGVEQTRFTEILFGLVGEVESARIKAALGPLL